MLQRVALVTGGTGGIGRAICRQLSEAGFALAIGYAASQAEAEALAASLGSLAVPLPAGQAPDEAIRGVEQHFGRLDVLVNAAGINLEAPALALPDEDWHKVLDVNLSFAFRLTRAALPLMLPARYGRVVHLSSVAARAGGRGQINYAAAKAALERLVRVFALEVGRKGVTVNCVAPGVIISNMSQRVRQAHEAELLGQIACRRFGRPEDVARAVAFLVSEGAGYINGAILPVDGGMCL